ncbi:MAG: serine/threonine protein kinase [Planctomycetes bacterium]|nr:serine/threonine protein kinase [Planctomycetota bacterium]
MSPELPNSTSDGGQVPADPNRAPGRSSPFPDIPGYEIESVIGRGATGTVYRARQTAVDREVALKVIHRELSAKTRTIQRLQREARTTARLAHPHIVSAIDMGQQGGLWWFAMELVDGPSLALRLRQEGRLNEREALRLFIQLAEALAHMHEHAVVHRDIKPANILIDRTGNARLADLGLAFAETDPSLTGSEGTLGTPHYISPEQSKDPSSVDIRTDIWSLGGTFFHALCGRPPFGGSSLAEVLSGVLYAPIPDPLVLEPELSPGLALVLRKCLSRSLDLRYQTPAELIADLERVRERRKPKVREGALEPLEGGWPAWAVRAVVGAGVALVLVGWWLLQVQTFGPDADSRYEPLEAVAVRADEGGAKLAGALADLVALQAALPPGQYERWTAVQARARGLLRDELERLNAEVGDRLDPLLAAGSIVAARAAFETELSTRLPQRTGFTAANLPAEFGAWFAPLEERIKARTLECEREAAARLSSHVREALLPEIDRAVGLQRWRDAQELTSVDGPALCSRARLDASGLPEASRNEATAPALALLAASRARIERDWHELDQGLATWIARRALELEGDLAGGRVSGAATRLRAEWSQELETRGLDRAQALSSADTWRRQLEQSCFELRERENRLRSGAPGLRRESVDALFTWLDELATEEAWRRRDYAVVRAYWDARAADLSVWTDESGEEAGRVVAERIELRLRELERAQRLLERAAEGARNMAGQWITLQVNSISVRGALRATVDPLADGLRIANERTSAEYGLRLCRRGVQRADQEDPLVTTADLLALAALAGAVDPLDAAVVQTREGAVEAAGATIDALDPSLEDPLLEELRERVRRARDLLQARSDRRVLEARALLAKAERWAADPRERERAREVVQQLLDHYLGVKEVAARRDWLRAQRTALDASTTQQAPQSESQWREALRARMRPDSLQFLTEGRARLRYTFETAESAPFEHGTWSADGLGWSRSTSVARLADLPREPGPSLDLAPLLDTAANLELTLELDQCFEDGPPRLFAASIGGVTVALLGAGLPSRTAPGWVGVSGGIEELLAKIDSADARTIENGLIRGARHQLRIEVRRAQGRVVVDLDGARLGRFNLSGAASDDTRVRLWSWEPVRLTGISITAHRP